MLKSKSRWFVKPYEKEKAAQLVDSLGIEPILAKLLVNRGIESSEAAMAFLNKEQQTFYDPFLLDGMDLAIERINHAIDHEEKILVFGDYDADGVTSTTVMLRALKAKGANVEYYIPNRFTEGYGPNEPAFRHAYEEGFSLIITVDTGISAIEEARFAKELGIDLIITDHHEPPPELPEAFIIIHPRKPGGHYPFGELAGVGVALKVAHALLGEVPNGLLSFAAVGTIADLVPLHDENRLIAALGLKAIQMTKNLGIQALLKVAGLEGKPITEETVGFSIGPRINAVGRLGSADPGVRLFMTDNAEEAFDLAKEIDEINRDRKLLVSELTDEAIEEVEKNYPLDENAVLVIAREGWNAGVIGIVASRLVERFYRPTIVLSIDPEKGEAKGSARSIHGFNLYENLSTCRDILPHFGGHPMAAGMTLKTENIANLRERLNILAFDQLTSEDFIPMKEVDLLCSIADTKLETIEQLNKLAPFGVGNPKPVVKFENVSFSQMRKIGSDGSHLKMILEENGKSLDSVGFGCGDLCEEIAPSSKISIIGELSINEWNGYRKPQLMVQDVAVNEWQLFDFRGLKNIDKQLQSIQDRDPVLISFQRNTIDRLGIHEWNHKILCLEDDGEVDFTQYVKGSTLVLLDLPQTKELIQKIVKNVVPNRIYTIFAHVEEHFFSTLPTRDHFKWFYAFLLKQKSFNIDKYAKVLSEHNGWSKETIQFMARVFLDLNFVTIENGVIKIVEKPAKREIEDSITYKQKKQQIELEQELIYSSYQTLREWFEPIIKGSLKVEEEMVNGL